MLRDSKIKLIDKVIKSILKNNLKIVDKRAFQTSKKKIEDFLDRLQSAKTIDRYSISDFYVFKDSVILSKGNSFDCVTYYITLDVYFDKLYDSARVNFTINVSK